MNNYIQADIKRVLLRVPRLITLGCLYAILAGMIIFSNSRQIDEMQLLLSFDVYLSIMRIFMGLMAMIAVYSMDFKAKTMQIAIGRGLSRSKIVLGKFIEAMIVVFLDLLGCGIIFFLVNAIYGVSFTKDMIMQVPTYLFCSWIAIISFISITMIFMFYKQIVGALSIIYFVLATEMVYMFINYILSNTILGKLNIDRFLLTVINRNFQEQLLSGKFSIKLFVGYIIYIGVSFFITVKLFKKKELEF